MPASAITSRGRPGRSGTCSTATGSRRNWRRSASPSNDIDYVMCTHLHTDHVGWNTRLENGRWVPTFPKARYIMSDRELAHWTQREKDNPSSVPWITDSVLPIVEAKRAQIVKSDFAFNERIQFIPTPGHTIDHFSVLVGRSRQRLPDHRRHDPLAAAGQISAIRHDVGLRFPAGRSRRGIRCSTASARARRSCARRIFRRRRPGGCGAGATATNSCRSRSDAGTRPLCYQAP